MYFPSAEVGMFPIKSLAKQLMLTGRYRYMCASDGTNAPGGGEFLGNLFQAYVEYIPVACLRTHAYFDYFLPGHYYPSSADNSWFLRFEMMFLF
jgi:hypothetical protein